MGNNPEPEDISVETPAAMRVRKGVLEAFVRKAYTHLPPTREER